MNIIKSIATIIILAVLMMVSAPKSSALQGDCYVSNGKPFCQYVTIDRIWAISNGDVFIGTSADESVFSSTNTCTPSSGNSLVLKAGTPGRDRVLSLFLIAHERRSVLRRVRLIENTSGCEIFYIYSDK